VEKVQEEKSEKEEKQRGGREKKNVTWSTDGLRFSRHCPDDVARFGYACKLFDGRLLVFLFYEPFF